MGQSWKLKKILSENPYPQKLIDKCIVNFFSQINKSYNGSKEGTHNYPSLFKNSHIIKTEPMKSVNIKF